MADVAERVLAGRVAIVTGAGNGIGRAIALAFAKAGAAVGCVDIAVEHADATAKAITAAGGQAMAVVCDVSSESDTLAAASAVHKRWGGVRVLVNAAAAYDPN